MKLWHFALIIMTLGIAYVLIKRPSVSAPTKTSGSSNAILGVISGGLSLTNKILDKVSAPSAVTGPSGGTYDVNPDKEIVGNTLVDESTGKTLTYGTD